MRGRLGHSFQVLLLPLRNAMRGAPWAEVMADARITWRQASDTIVEKLPHVPAVRVKIATAGRHDAQSVEEDRFVTREAMDRRRPSPWTRRRRRSEALCDRVFSTALLPCPVNHESEPTLLRPHAARKRRGSRSLRRAARLRGGGRRAHCGSDERLADGLSTRQSLGLDRGGLAAAAALGHLAGTTLLLLLNALQCHKAFKEQGTVPVGIATS
jgi:hypothetical protein